MKSTVEQIRERFDHDVERFSHLETGNTAQVDSILSLELIAEAASTHPHPRSLLDVGCGAGNYALKILERLPNLDVSLLDLSQPMLERAQERVRTATRGEVRATQGDIREVALEENRYDLIVASAVLHHLRTDQEWNAVFARLFRALRPGGMLWIYDLLQHEIPAVERRMWERYGRYLEDMKDSSYRDHVFSYIEQEDTPRPLTYQLELLRAVGFKEVDVLHKNTSFAAFGARKADK
jgi:tRNA (cmo5U34)-methyltransferase